MKNLLKKEFSLVFHPTIILLLFPYLMILNSNNLNEIAYIFSTMEIYSMCLQARENKDADYMMALPVTKKDMVKSRIVMIVITEIFNIIFSIPFIIIRNSTPELNKFGIQANIALIGIAFIIFGIFNFLFFILYYRNTSKVGVPYMIALIGGILVCILSPILIRVVPFFKDYLNTKDPEYMIYKLLFMFVGIIIFAALTYISYKKALKSFNRQDLWFSQKSFRFTQLNVDFYLNLVYNDGRSKK